jgi:hypothetical protein
MWGSKTEGRNTFTKPTADQKDGNWNKWDEHYPKYLFPIYVRDIDSTFFAT